jgi:hypothetical protein
VFIQTSKQTNKKVLQTSAFLPGLLLRVQKNWEQIYLTSFRWKAKSFDCNALAVDKSNIRDSPRLLTFIRGTDVTFKVREELGGVCSFKGTTGEDLFVKVREALQSLKPSWKKLKCNYGWLGKRVVLRPV